jgi:predicted dehydrogenase
VYIPALLAHPNVELVAVNRPEQAELDKVVARFGVPGFTDHEALLAQVKPDGVVISSAHTVHFAQGMAALNAGAHVLIDKPMTTSAADARALVARASQVGQQILIPYGWNYKDFTRRAAALMDAGGVGEVRHVVCQMASPTGDLFGGAGLVETTGHMFRPPVSTWADPARAGGYGWGQLSHALGLIFRLVNLAPVQVYAIGGKSPAGVDYYDAATLRLSNGATAVISGAATVPKQAGYQVDIRIFGSEGMLLLDVERERMALYRNDGRDEVMDVPAGAGAYACEEPVARLADVCLGRAVEIEADGTVGLRAVEVLDAMYRSMASNLAEDV